MIDCLKAYIEQEGWVVKDDNHMEIMDYLVWNNGSRVLDTINYEPYRWYISYAEVVMIVVADKPHYIAVPTLYVSGDIEASYEDTYNLDDIYEVEPATKITYKRIQEN